MPEWVLKDTEPQAVQSLPRNLPEIVPSRWPGWPDEWGQPGWDSQKAQKLADTAWACLDLNSSVLSSMPVYRMKGTQVIDPVEWMRNPDPKFYTAWPEFAAQLFWNFQAFGEAFVVATDWYHTGYPSQFHVVPPYLVSVEIDPVKGRSYAIGSLKATQDGDILHLRYQSSTDDAHGHGPLEVAGARLTAAKVLGRYAQNLAKTGGVPHYVVNVERSLSKTEADDMLEQWVDSRMRNLGYPALVSGGKANVQAFNVNAKDMALIELAQFSESRIATLLKVPPFLVGLPSGGDSMTYSNVSSLFDFHDRAGLRTLVAGVMPALSNWALPRGQTVELNRDEYSRPPLLERAQAYEKLDQIGALSPEEIRVMERFHGLPSAAALTGGEPDAEPDQPDSAADAGQAELEA